jgi:5-methylcytosine-specific restriction endonuclease McrA
MSQGLKPLKNKTINTCEVCGRKFLAERKNSLTCSQACRSKKALKNTRKRRENGEGCFYKLRFEIFKRDSFRCFYCGRSSIEDGVTLEIEHINPLDGEKQDWRTANPKELVTSCRDCNAGKTNTILSLPILKRITDTISVRSIEEKAL